MHSQCLSVHATKDLVRVHVPDPEDPWADAWTQEIAEHIGMPSDKLVE
jgi:predicted alpha/beta hydrolase family esterase